ncbi:molybdenum cofactor synthesis domain-containing protein [Caldanaerovirga acetigignens]|jgi:molybdenum cofactor synthesis domain-containing protein|uniref:Molybdenum cofactor synthesis domain-containing protein n=1 Tax=Caldanaerovirga acetigignens TaxID=447595 RepID=A0A1M7IXT9_9FIRM|nr:MOSC domain-containing protein [Caldanaerovirga acetigignens]SHM45463.1 molybdenum cofactor synthesis domain-containing protein [Caldanaerovirga acetigignens]
MGRIVAVSISEKKGEKKQNVRRARLIEDFGLEGDAHAGSWHRQVSLLAKESIEKMKKMGLAVGPGDFAENITTEGIDLGCLPVGTRLEIGDALLEVTQIGKECHSGCAIFKQVGQCIMPREGIFARVLRGGVVSEGDEIKVIPLIRVGILTASDRGARGEREDKSAKVIEELIATVNGKVEEYILVSDDLDAIKESLMALCEKGLDLILTTGGTGFSPRDNTPEATLAVIEKQVPGIPEAMRQRSLEKTPHAMLSRAVAGIRGKSLIINLPGSPRAVRENLEVVLPALPHAVELLKVGVRDCGRMEE